MESEDVPFFSRFQFKEPNENLLVMCILDTSHIPGKFFFRMFVEQAEWCFWWLLESLAFLEQHACRTAGQLSEEEGRRRTANFIVSILCFYLQFIYLFIQF